MGAHFRNSDPTANSAIKAADKTPRRIPRDRALQLAAEARIKGDLAGEQLFLAAARRGGGL